MEQKRTCNAARGRSLRMAMGGVLAWAVLLAFSLLASAMAEPRGPRLAGAELTPGSVLLATSSIRSDAFSRSVVLILKHDDQSTQGLILNQSMALPVKDAMPILAGLLTSDQPIFHGGPVDPASIRVVVQADVAPEGAVLISDHLALINDLAVLRRLLATPDPPPMRFFVGYAGWGAGQLIDEMLDGHWQVLRDPVLNLFETEPGALWPLLMFEANGRIALK